MTDELWFFGSDVLVMGGDYDIAPSYELPDDEDDED